MNAVSGENHKQSEPVFPPTESPIRALSEEEVERLQLRLGRPVDRNFLVHWVSQAIRDVVRLSQDPSAREIRDGLARIAQDGRQWLHDVEGCPGIACLSRDLNELKSAVERFCDDADRLAKQFSALVKRGRRRTPLALEAFLSTMIGIAKKAKVYPSAEGRALRSQTAPRRSPDFFEFLIEALKIADEVIMSSPLPDDRKHVALSMLAVPSRGALSKLIERLRGKISDYRESSHGLLESRDS